MSTVRDQTVTAYLKLQRRRVYSALKPILDSKTLYECLWLWEEEFSNRKSMQMRKYIAVLVEKGYLVTSAHTAYKKLVYFFMQDANNLEDDPYEEMLHFRNNQAKETAPVIQAVKTKFKSSGNIVFENMLGNFLASVKTINGQSIDIIAIHLSKSYSNLKISKAQRTDLKAWVCSQSSDLDMDYNIKQMSAIINATYVVACNYIGPVKADRFLSLAVKKSEQLPEALKFSPRQLL